MSQENVYCCDTMAAKQRVDGKFTITCDVCGRKVESETPDGAVSAFKVSVGNSTGEIFEPMFDDPTPDQPIKDVSPRKTEPAKPVATRPPEHQQTKKPEPPANDMSLPTIAPKRPADLAKFFAENLAQMADIATPIVGRDRPALTRLIKNNIRYVMTIKSPAFAKCWTSSEGQESIVFAIEEALALGAELGKMGSLVPFGGICEFIPAVEAFEFALTNGADPPFKDIQIEMIHASDIKKISRINGEFSCQIEIGIPRGDLVSVVVYGKQRNGKVVGEVYDKERLLEKAKIHSSSYRYYLQNLAGFEMARTEGRISVDTSGREYADVKVDKGEDKYAEQDRQAFEKAEAAGELKKDGKGDYAENVLNKKDGSTWTKKIYRSAIEDGFELKRVYRDELSNPYDGADQPEMLRKAAGKSFLGKYVRVRNSEAAIEETRGGSDANAVAGAAIDAAFDAMPTQPSGAKS